MLAGQVIWFYAAKLLLPLKLNFYYYRWPLDAGVWRQWIFPAAVMVVLVVLWAQRKRIGKAPFAGALSFVALLFPALGFFPVFPMIFSWVADHFAYLSAAAFIPMACAGAGGWRRGGWLPWRPAQWVIALAHCWRRWG